MITFKVPSGIGDLSWIYSKLINFKRDYRLVICGDNPRRTLPFAELLTGVRHSEYGNFSYWPTFMIKKLGISPNQSLNELEDGKEYYLSANLHLDNGGKLADFLPGTKTTYHYKIKSSLKRKKKVDNWLSKKEGPFIGIYTSKYSSYRKDWKFWTKDKWVEFIEGIYDLTGATFVFIGAEFDLDLGKEIVFKIRKKKIPYIDLIGKTHIADCWCLINKLDYVFAYASGIGILCDVIDTPATHYLPTPRHNKLCDTYADPINIESGRHINKLFCPVEEAVDNFKNRGLELIGEKIEA
jgi:hypothetical protein